MKKILHIISSPRGESSFSIKLGNAIVEKLKALHPDALVKELNLAKQDIPHLSDIHLNAFFTPADLRSDDLRNVVKFSEESIADLMEADYVVIGAPMYNFAIPSTLKAWLDQVCRAGVTFRYTENGPEGLVQGKKVYLAVTTGGVYSEGPMNSFDFISSYLKAVLGFIGMTDVTVYRVEGTAIPEMKDSALEKGLSSIVLQ